MTLRCDFDDSRGSRIGLGIDVQNSQEFIRRATARDSQSLAASVTLRRPLRCRGMQLGSIRREGMLCVSGGID
jgi:hypothetical protein